MPRINPASAPEAKAQEQLAGVQKMLGSTPNIFTTLANSPAALSFYTGANAALGATKLPGKLREQLAIAIAGMNGCDYCASAHTVFGKMHKLTDAELMQNLQAQSPDAKTQAALTFTRQVVEKRGRVSDAEVAAVRNAGYSDGEIMEIMAIIGVNLFTNYVNLVAGTEVDFPLVSTSRVAAAA